MALLSTVTAETPGIFGDLVVVSLTYTEGGPDFTATIVNGTGIDLEIGTTGGVPNLDWNGIAAAFNASPAVAAIASMVGTANSGLPNGNVTTVASGFAGAGLGQFFFSAAIAPPAPVNLPPPGGARLPVALVPNDHDFCLHREYRLYIQIDYEKLGCGRLPACFKIDEREWGDQQ